MVAANAQRSVHAEAPQHCTPGKQSLLANGSTARPVGHGDPRLRTRRPATLTTAQVKSEAWHYAAGTDRWGQKGDDASSLCYLAGLAFC